MKKSTKLFMVKKRKNLSTMTKQKNKYYLCEKVNTNLDNEMEEEFIYDDQMKKIFFMLVKR